jgi:hypothetical protein
VASACALALSALTAFGSGEPSALAASKYPTPAITVANGNTVVAAETSAHGLHFYWNEFGTNTWHAQQVVGNASTYSAPAMIGAPTGQRPGSTGLDWTKRSRIVK